VGAPNHLGIAELKPSMGRMGHCFTSPGDSGHCTLDLVSRRRSGASDTDPEIDAMMVAAYREMSPREKMRRVLACNEASEAMALAGLRSRHPGLSERELRLHLAALRLGPKTMLEVFGWDPERRGDG
jgi:hypothetical protein